MHNVVPVAASLSASGTTPMYEGLMLAMREIVQNGMQVLMCAYYLVVSVLGNNGLIK